MDSNVDLEARFVNTLRTQPKTPGATHSDSLPCPFCNHQGRVFQNTDQLLSHVSLEHASILQSMETSQARAQVRKAALKL
jgi:hypothetical protein